MRKVYKIRHFITFQLVVFAGSVTYSQSEASLRGDEKPAVVRVPAKDGAIHFATGRDAVLYCVMTNDTKVLRRLLAEGHDIKTPLGTESWTFLHFASQKGYTGVAALLLRSGADLNARNSAGHTPWDVAIANSHKEMADWLLSYKSKH